MLYFTGDIHGNAIDRFFGCSFKEEDIIFVLGDCGIPWGNSYFEDDIAQLDFLSKYKCTFIFIAGNHDNYDLIEEMPFVKKFNGLMRQMQYNNKTYYNIFYIDIPEIFTIEGKSFLIIPGAESHDIYNGILENDEFLKENIIKKIYDEGQRHGFRINHLSWWKQEKIKKEKVKEIINTINYPIDFILSHDYPSIINNFYARPGSFRQLSTESQILLDQVRKNINYKIWLHGHIHKYLNWSKYNIISLYHDILSEEEIIKLYNDNIEEQYCYYDDVYKKREKWNLF